MNKAVKLFEHMDKAIFPIAGILFVLIIPQVTNNYSMTVMNTVFLYYIAALGVSVLLGMTGMMSFAAVTFMGSGAAFTILFSKTLGWHPLISLLLSVVGSGVFAFLVGLVLVKLKGSYLTFATIGLVQIMSNVYINFRPIMNGSDGVSGIPKLDLVFFTPTNERQWFYVLVGFSLVCGLIVQRIRKTHLGRAMASIRDNEIAAQCLGINIYRTRLIAFVIAGCLAGLSGALFGHHNSFVTESLFTYNISLNFVVMVMLGGVNSTIGTFLGSLLVTMLPEWLRFLEQYLRLIYGIGIILLMIYMPLGLAGLYDLARMKIKKRIARSGTEKSMTVE